MRIVNITSILSFMILWLIVTMAAKMFAEPIPTFETPTRDVSEVRPANTKTTQLFLK